MSILTVHTKNYPHRAVIDSEKAKHLRAGLYTGIRVEQHDVHSNQVIAAFDADLQYAIKSMEAGFGTMAGTYLIRVRPIVVAPQAVAPTQPTPVQSLGFKARRKSLALSQKQIIRRTGLSPYQISLLENDKLDLRGCHENTWDKLPLGYGEDFVASVRESLKDLP